MPEKTPRARRGRLVDALIVWITPDRQLGPGLNRFEVRVSRSRRHVDRTSAVVKMDSLAPTRRGRARAPDGGAAVMPVLEELRRRIRRGGGRRGCPGAPTPARRLRRRRITAASAPSI